MMTELPSIPDPVPQIEAAPELQAAVRQAAAPGEYVYDVYVPVPHSMAATPATTSSNQSSAQQQHCPTRTDAAVEAADTPIIHVWEEDLLDCHDLWAARVPAEIAEADEDSEDSNAEGHYANSYPDEEGSYQDSQDDSADHTWRAAGGEGMGLSGGAAWRATLAGKYSGQSAGGNEIEL
eukprot:gene11692-11836_t